MFGFLDQNGNYYEVAEWPKRFKMPEDQPVPIRPSPYHIWVGWSFSVDKWRQGYVVPKAQMLLTEADAIARRYETQKVAELLTTDTEEVYNQTLMYMQQLRDLMVTMTPESETWPEKPAWVE